ncbi:MAG TPA: tetratricopeptide repeat protein [Caldithrix abyssi]|uniref:Tetratricopeptide repeat protein n=1 Tax=Caldithrix abyssi TaxID=187145 RepID=A0A7V4WWU4_CALAY|nr:tetratricopeptide repeat protein [Caldithrix abyssi]
MNRLFINFLTLLSLFVFIALNSCAGTRDGEPAEDEAAATKNDENLDDIEKLLGITTEESSSTPTKTFEPKKQSKNDEEKLKLLDSGELAKKERKKSSSYMAAANAASKDKEKEEIKKLKKQLARKDRQISDLQAKIEEQDKELAKLVKRKQSYSYTPGGAVGTVGAGEYESTYQDARAAFEAHDYNRALQLFESLLASSTTHSLSDNAQYWIGECHYALGQYNAAIIAFEKVFTFPRSNKKDDAQFKLGLCYLRKGDKAKAREEFNRLQTDYPKSEYVTRAQKLLAKL